MAVTGRFALLALLGVVPLALVPGWVTFAVVATALLLVVVLDVVRAASTAQLSMTRSGPVSCRLGDSVQLELLVTNTGTRHAHGRLRDAWLPSAGALPASHALDIPAGERRVLSTQLTPTRRGDRRPARITVRCLGPLGVAGRQGSHEVPWQVRVQPSFASRRFLPERLARLRQLDGQLLTRGRGQGTEFDSLRDYVEGDDVRSIDWRATARRTSVVVRTWRPERDRRLLLVIDSSRTSAGRVGDAPRLDAALDAVLLVAALAVRAGDRVDLLAFDRRVQASVEGAGRSQTMRRIADAMAGVEPALVEADSRRLVAEVLRRVRQRALVVLFTGLEAPALQEGLLPSLGLLTRRHTVVLASVADPRVAQLQSGRGDLDAVYGAAAAEQWLGERRAMAALLRQRGVEVVDAAPDAFAPAVADTYLSLKAAGRL